jgi:DNA-binding transcriptional MerR regulator
MKVATLAEQAGVSAHTVRYYERSGLIPRAQRAANGYRDFGPADVDRLLFIQGCQRLGLRLREIKTLLAVRDTGVCPCEPAADLMARRISEIDAEMERLRALRAEIAAIAAGLPGSDCRPPTPGTWCPEEVNPRELRLLRRPAV